MTDLEKEIADFRDSIEKDRKFLEEMIKVCSVHSEEAGKAAYAIQEKEKVLKIIESLQTENQRLLEALRVVDYCLSDYVITDHGIKIVNQKDLVDAQELLREVLEKINGENND